MNTMSLIQPNSLQTPEQQTEALQYALQTVENTVNANATSALVSVYVASFADSNEYSNSGAAAQIPSYAWTFNAQGGLVVIEGNITGTISDGAFPCQVFLYIDGQSVLMVQTQGTLGGSTGTCYFSCPLLWKTILTPGKHTVSVWYAGNSSHAIHVNAVGQSTLSIIEFPNNVQSSS